LRGSDVRLVTAPEWSVVIPAFNEARRLPRYLAEIAAYFDGRDEPYEVLVADDGSTDGTAEAVAAIVRAHPALRVLRHEWNEGKGAAVRRGMLAARGQYRLFADADGATPIVELKRLEAALMAGAQIAIGSRARLDPSVSVVARPHRVLAGRVFSRIVRRLGLPGVIDSQCGFKAFTAPAATDLFARLRTSGFGFDVELLLLAQAAGYRVTEVPVNWTDQPGSKVRVLVNGPGILRQAVAARLRMGRRR
jgi:dolichyl-phosphate beta-glucosyltransferase